ncbi:MFS transporter [Burkholderia gladioli]|uniref:MFS transporter n=1 Tax=Burkholderia gladioli TaxID=28095 RepID=UPI00163E7AA9|nr:MFS transporter [Burkholderia gladioli]
MIAKRIGTRCGIRSRLASFAAFRATDSPLARFHPPGLSRRRFPLRSASRLLSGRCSPFVSCLREAPLPASTISRRAHAERALLLVLSLSVFFVGTGEFMLSAMLAPLGAAFGADTARVAWLVSAYALAYAIAAPLLGKLADRVARGRLLCLALLAFAIDGLGIAFSPELGVAIGLRVFGGLASAIIIPSAFALVAEQVPRARHASAMGAVMLGMTLGIAFGPAMAGSLTAWAGWRTPFLANSAGCLLVLLLGVRRLSINHAPPCVSPDPGSWRWLRIASITRPLLAKGIWNGTAVSAFLLSGEVLRRRHGFDDSRLGLSMSVFGIGLGIGNLAAGRLRKLAGGEERALRTVVIVLLVSVLAFHAWPLPLAAALACLAAWGAALGVGAPLATTVLAERSSGDKGTVLASAETLNNLVILALVPLASLLSARGHAMLATALFAAGIGAGAALTWHDARAAR